VWFRPYGTGIFLSLKNSALTTTYLSVAYNGPGNSFSVVMGASTLTMGPSVPMGNTLYL
jgi:hypothetical protein